MPDEVVEVVERPSGSMSGGSAVPSIDPSITMFRLNRFDVAKIIECSLKNMVYDPKANEGRGGFINRTTKIKIYDSYTNSTIIKETPLPPLIEPEEAIDELINSLFKGINHKGTLLSYNNDRDVLLDMKFFRDHVLDVLFDGQVHREWKLNCHQHIVHDILEYNFNATLKSAWKGGERDSVNKTAHEQIRKGEIIQNVSQPRKYFNPLSMFKR